MKRKMILMLVLVMVMVLATSAVAWADTGEEEEGVGTIVAHGVGIAMLRGDGRIDIRGHGVGVVWIAGAENLDVSGDGYRHDFEQGVLLVGWKGEIHAVGEKMTVRMAGGLIDFKATGRGFVFLKGEGWYRIGDQEGRWHPRGRRFRLGIPPQAPPPQAPPPQAPPPPSEP
ncbi:MAG TPA: D-alanine--poly(phosphoribitol) ligase [Caldilineae bacterium]|nr:D-alanine--poly(phosphoribitol) ligase [Caldilineae bacterium]